MAQTPSPSFCVALFPCTICTCSLVPFPAVLRHYYHSCVRVLFPLSRFPSRFPLLIFLFPSMVLSLPSSPLAGLPLSFRFNLSAKFSCFLHLAFTISFKLPHSSFRVISRCLVFSSSLRRSLFCGCSPPGFLFLLALLLLSWGPWCWLLQTSGTRNAVSDCCKWKRRVQGARGGDKTDPGDEK